MRLKSSGRLFADETTVPVLDPGRGRTKTGQLWAYAADDRPWGGSDPPGVAYVYAPDRKAERPIAHLEDSRESCRSAAMPATASWPSVATSSLHSAGRICGATSTNSPLRVPADRSFDGIVIDLDAAIVDEAGQAHPSATGRSGSPRRACLSG
jgi:hypothetical protein